MTPQTKTTDLNELYAALSSVQTTMNSPGSMSISKIRSYDPINISKYSTDGVNYTSDVPGSRHRTDIPKLEFTTINVDGKNFKTLQRSGNKWVDIGIMGNEKDNWVAMGKVIEMVQHLSPEQLKKS